MEAFADRQGVHKTWSNRVARLQHDGNRMVLTALVLEDPQPGQKLRGVKIDLSSGNALSRLLHRGPRDRIYLDEAAAERTRSALEEIAEAVARERAPRNGCMGAREFWPLYNWPWNKYHELNADFCRHAGASAALVLHGRGKHESFNFTGETPTHLAGMLTAAMDELKQH
jgi:hypothetical protein